MIKLKSLKDLKIEPGTRVFVAIDADVPINSSGRIEDDFRLRALIPSLNFLVKAGAVLTLGGHLGRPQSKLDLRLSLLPVKKVLESLLKVPIIFLDNPLSPVSAGVVSNALPGTVNMLENLRFHPGEEKGDLVFAKVLALYGQFYVNENFATSHRRDASLAVVSTLLPSVAGLRLVEEVDILQDFRHNAPKPLISVVGGVKVADKGSVVKQLSSWSDYVLVGGKVGFELAAKDVPNNVILPQDGIEGKDLGPKTIADFLSYIKQAKSVLWVGPLGLVEQKAYQKATKILSSAAVDTADSVLIGGGDTLKVFKNFRLLSKVTWASVGGGAMLSFLAGNDLPGLTALLV